MPAITFLTTCKGRLEFLQQTLPRTAAQVDADVIVVDYDCPQHAGIWVKENFPNVRVVSVENEPMFHAARARNLGAALIRTPWVCFCDADILFEPAFSQNLLPLLKAGHFYLARPMTRGMYGSVIVRHEDFVNVGGYDEAITEWGGEDHDLYCQLGLRGVSRENFPGAWMREITHADDLRTTNHEIKDLQPVYRINLLYPQIKQEVMQLLHRPLRLEERQALYREIRDTVLKTPADKMTRIEVALPSLHMLLADLEMPMDKRAQILERTLIFNLKPGKVAS